MAGWCLQGKGVRMFRGRVWARAVGLGLVGVVMAGCAGPGAELTPSPSVSASGTSLSVSASLSDAELYALAVSQYEKLFAIVTEIDRQGGAAVLPDEINAYLMDPAWSAVSDLYSRMALSGDHYYGSPNYEIMAIAPLTDDTSVTGSLVEIQTCESDQGAALVSADGTILEDDGQVITHRLAYFKFDTDGQLKVFVLNGGAVDTCPIK